MTRDEAQSKRLMFYDDARGCRHGHSPTKRYTSTGNCVSCARQRNTFKPVRVYIKPEQRAVFDALAKQFGWEVVTNGSAEPQHTEVKPNDKPLVHRSRLNGDEDYSEHIPA